MGNDEFKELLESLQKSSLESKSANGDAETPATELEEGEVEPENHESSPVPEQFYDKKKSFFDSISCEATEKSKVGPRPRNDRNAEFKLNKETFGVAGYRGKGRGDYYNRRGYNNGRGNRGNGQNQYRGSRGGGEYRGNR